MTVRFPAFAAAWSGDVCGGGGASSYNPLTDWTTPPVHAMWAADPLWTPPADGGAVSSWRNGGSVGTPDFTQGTAAARPTYDASNAAFGGQPSVNFDGTDDVLAVAITAVPVPWFLVMVLRVRSVNTTRYVVSDGTGNKRLMTFSPGHLRFQWTTAQSTTANQITAAAALWDFSLTSGTDTFRVDGSTVLSADSGSGDFGPDIFVGAYDGAGTSAAPLDLHALLLFTSDPTAQPEWTDFVDYCENTVGLTIA